MWGAFIELRPLSFRCSFQEEAQVQQQQQLLLLHSFVRVAARSL